MIQTTDKRIRFTSILSVDVLIPESMDEQSVREDRMEISPDQIDGVSLQREQSIGTVQWSLMGRPFPRSEVKFFAQVLMLYVVILTCLGNLSVGKGELDPLWISLLSSCIGLLLPVPFIPKKTGPGGPV